MKILDREAIEWFIRTHGLKSPWPWEGDVGQAEEEPGVRIVCMTPEGTVSHPPQWWLAQMLDGTELGKKHLEVLKHYLEQVRGFL